MAKTIFTAQQRARIISFRGRMPALQVAQKVGCLSSTIRKIWSRSSKKAASSPKIKTSLLTGFAVLNNKVVEPLPPEPLIDHGFLLLELGEGQCSWPLQGRDADGRLRFCGAPRKTSDRLCPCYCEQHASRAHIDVANPWETEQLVNYTATSTELQHSEGPHADDILLDELAEAA